ncbi:Pimeloyl-ACP methyl ester carboxylesterase [Jatrophihabitans endophyticus]|uniref:Pimeloyl-ACP methyl ester carboxylesterase n=1 Tax=Jatrophihabitans endophyticus TaxID=1206085 RepID=A0A1M5EU24_9ACTN|nr:alpha/beta fold hydrolase [Jatrophihabitans endophyticus]SHF82720.1 Pimeloyl-ACP methyl ester carboxylesterase [Jatrophihabitans endophyticus]
MPKPPARTVPVARFADAGLISSEDVDGPWPGTHVEVGDIRVHLRTTPATSADAEPALFVHGLAGSALNWTDFAGALRGRLAIEALDLPGHGLSGPAPRGRYSPQLHADTVVRYLEQSGRGPVHLVGNSMGGAVSILVAAQRPDLVRTLTLLAPAVPDNRLRIYPLRANPRFALVFVPVLGELVTRLFNSRYAPEVRAKGTIALCFADRSRFPAARMRELVDEVTERGTSPWAEAAVLRSMRSLAKSQLLGGRAGWRTMRRVAAPTLVVWGDRDRLVAPDLAPYVAAAVPNSRLLEMDDIGHTPMMEAPGPTARAVLAFLDDTAVDDGPADRAAGS